MRFASEWAWYISHPTWLIMSSSWRFLRQAWLALYFRSDAGVGEPKSKPGIPGPGDATKICEGDGTPTLFRLYDLKFNETLWNDVCFYISTVTAYTTHRIPFQDISRCFRRLCKVDRFVVAKRIWRAFWIHICSLFPQRVNPMMIGWSKAIQLEWLKSDFSPGWHGYLNEIWHEQFYKSLVIYGYLLYIGVYSLPSYIRGVIISQL